MPLDNGNLFAEPNCLLYGNPSQVYIEAYQPCKVLMMRQHNYERFRASAFYHQLGIVQHLYRSLEVDFLQKIIVMLRHKSSERLGYLKSFYPSLLETAPMNQIALFLNMPPQSLSRSKSQL